MVNNDGVNGREQWARLRFSIVGPLLAAPPGPGELRQALTWLSEKSWRHPITGAPVRFGASTIERWFWEHVREVWHVKQTTIELKTGETTLDERFFLTSLPLRTLTNAQVLQAVRMHWGVENNGFWTLDCAWFEDDAPWTHHALLFVSLLRLLAYNAVSRLLTRRLRQAKARALSWGGILTLLEHACCQLRQHWLAEHKAAPVTSA